MFAAISVSGVDVDEDEDDEDSRDDLAEDTAAKAASQMSLIVLLREVRKKATREEKGRGGRREEEVEVGLVGEMLTREVLSGEEEGAMGKARGRALGSEYVEEEEVRVEGMDVGMEAEEEEGDDKALERCRGRDNKTHAESASECQAGDWGRLFTSFTAAVSMFRGRSANNSTRRIAWVRHICSSRSKHSASFKQEV